MAEATEPYLAIQLVMMPRDTNPYGTIFGGVILSHIDMAGAIGARRAVIDAGGSDQVPLVTVAINRVEFKEPVFVGHVVRNMTRPTRIGRTSVTIHVAVEAERGDRRIPVTEAELVYVSIGPQRQPVPLLPEKNA
jgi:acyl-CoA thioesterase YciA